MLNIDTASLSNDTLHRLLDDRDHVNYLLHPDVKIEVLMAEQRKHMRIAQLLKLSQSPPEPPHPLQVIRPREGVPQGEGRGMPVPAQHTAPRQTEAGSLLDQGHPGLAGSVVPGREGRGAASPNIRHRHHSPSRQHTRARRVRGAGLLPG